MPNITLVGDTAGGGITNSQGISATINGIPIAVAGDSVVAHDPCPVVPVHCSAVMTATLNVTINGIRVVVQGDLATCRHPANASAASSIS